MRRTTKQREAIIRLIRTTSAHPTADQIYDAVRKEIPRISKGTVYRNLKALEEDGAVAVLNTNGFQSRYEIKQQSHYHFRCEKCGRVCDIDEPVLSELDEKVARKTGFLVKSHQTEFRGLCKECQQ